MITCNAVRGKICDIRKVEKNKRTCTAFTSADGVQKSFGNLKRVRVNFVSNFYMRWSNLM